MAAKKRKPKKKIYCRGMRKGNKMVKKSTCARSRCAGQMNGSTKGGKPRRRKKSVCLKPKRAAAKRKAPARKRAVKRGVMRKGVKVGRKKVYGAAALAVAKKRARKGRAAPKRHRAWRGSAGASIGSISREQARIEHELREINRDLKDLRSY